MKRFVEELERALIICSMCPTGQRVQDYLDEKKRKEEEERAAIERGEPIPVERKRPSMYIGDSLAKNLAKHVIEATQVNIHDDRTEEEKEEDSYNEMIKLMLSRDGGISCKYLQKWESNLNINRDFDFPTEEKEILRILDDLSGCYFYNCIYLGALKSPVNRMEKITREVLAKYDFFLLERGIDIMPLCEIVGLEYYKREEDISSCGYSYALINHYLERLKDGDSMPLSAQVLINGSPELSHALKEHYIDINGKMLKSVSDFVRFCIRNDYYRPWGRREFRRISEILKKDDGTPIHENSLAQAYSDIKKTQQGDNLRTE